MSMCSDASRLPSGSTAQHWKLDAWEDDARRRRRLVPDARARPAAAAADLTAHAHAHAHCLAGAAHDAVLQSSVELSGRLGVGARGAQLAPAAELVDDAELLVDERDLDADLAGPVNISTRAQLVAPGLAAPGTLSLTSAELYFEVDDDDPAYKAIDPEVSAL
ncbi:hypothetical protein ACJJTC_006463 [Scirpophaga incertulas]